MIRFLDFFISLIGLIILSPLLVIIFFFLFFENGSPLFKQQRAGINQKIFTLIKFRTMPKNTKSLPTHLIKNSSITPFQFALRKIKLDALPLLFNVLLGQMSLVGPRPCLLNQKKLIKERKKRGVFNYKPGITGLAQISGINMKTPTILSKTDIKMMKKMSLNNYFFYIFNTLLVILKKN